MSPHLLSQRLKKLETQGLIRRETYSERPPRYEYRLTEKGRDLWAIIVAMKQWGVRWLNAYDTPVQIIHKTCGRVVKPQMNCPDCGEPMDAHAALSRPSASFDLARQTAGRVT